MNLIQLVHIPTINETGVSLSKVISRTPLCPRRISQRGPRILQSLFILASGLP